LGLYPLFPSEDVGKTEYSSYVAQRVEYASYGPESHTITINLECDETFRFLILNLFGVLGHAQYAEQEGRIFKKPNRTHLERITEQVAVWSFEYKVLAAIGGQEYQVAMKEGVSQITWSWREKTNVPPFRDKGMALSHCFGEPRFGQSQVKAKRDYRFFVYCAFMAADVFLKEEAAFQYKSQVLWKMYGESLGHEKTIMGY